MTSRTDDLQAKDKARGTLGRKVREGRITRQPCTVCGDPKTDAHHDDYAKPLDVRWLCRAHHSELHHGPKKPKRGRPPRKRILDPTVIGRLEALSGQIRPQQEQVRALELERNTLVRQALAEGWTHQQVKDATGLSRGRIGQIKRGV